MTTVGQITSTPDVNSNRVLKCPNCRITFLAPTTKDHGTGELRNAVYKNCHRPDEPLAFVRAANKAQTNKIMINYAER